MKPQQAKKLRRAGTAAVLAAVLAFGAPSSSWAYWSASASPAKPAVSAAVVPIPGSFSCKSSGGLLGIGSTANYTWGALTGGTAWRYVVHLRSADGSIDQTMSAEGQTTTSINIGQGVLTGLLSGILELLLGNQQIYVSVTALHPSGWDSKKTAEIPMRRATLLGGITC